MAKEAESSKMISLKTIEGDIFKVSPSIIKEMQTVQSIIDGNSSITSSTIPLLDVHTFELSKIIDYYDYHCCFHGGKTIDPDTVIDEVKEFNMQFVKQLSHNELKELMVACYGLKAKELLELLIQSTAKLIENKSVEFMRNFLGVVNDFTPEEEAKFREDNAWAFEGVDED